ncbi:MarR family winged helix-turn-helix transcriptional regulator [Amycolatopsis taiwanensis]|uniref:MarR family transcriptional regulator n=1 Tax=Amycolatopsis taiwanensis TaxID=342230 RepID=A0A9W6VHF9_9PSEU|nr:MarR family transcriptional regulator [Amycolatopsis taiwanensis]GLY67179.1 MarR family transcriptional regulator [Amycolatopsis taiwanensis]
MPVPNEIARLAGELRGLVGQLRRRLRQVDNAGVLTPTQSAVLARLDREGPATQAQLAAAERVRQQSMAATLAALDQAGLLDRTRDPDDGRRVVISLSDVGRKTVRGLIQHREEWLAAALATGFTDDERRTIAEALPLLRRLAQRED